MSILRSDPIVAVITSPDAPSQGTGEKSSAKCELLVSIIVLNYKRREALAQTLDSVLCQDYPNTEIIVVDNHSEEDIRSLVANCSSDISLIELSHNVGSCAGRNAGIRVARGEFIITIDNDVNLASPSEVSNVVKTFQSRPEAHVLVFQICDADTGQMRIREWCHPKYWKEFSQSEFDTYFLPEGASAFRKEVFEAVGLYYEPFFIGNEGGDLALRILDHGFHIRYVPQIRVWHRESPVTRSQPRTYRLYTRNYIWLAYKNYRGFALIRYLTFKLSMMLYLALRADCLIYFLKGCWEGLVGLEGVRPHRRPVRKATVHYVAELDKGRPGWRLRLARHRAQPQI